MIRVLGCGMYSRQARPLAAEITDLPKIVAFRNQLMHNYVTVDHATVWGVANTSLPKLMADVNALLAKWPDA